MIQYYENTKFYRSILYLNQNNENNTNNIHINHNKHNKNKQNLEVELGLTTNSSNKKRKIEDNSKKLIDDI